MLRQENREPVIRLAALLGCALCLALAAPCYSSSGSASTLLLGSADDDRAKAEHQAQKAMTDLGLDINVSDAGVVRIGSSFAVDQDEVIDSDVVIIGGALTVEGTINGDAVVVGGSMYLAETATVHGDAVVVGGILEQEPGATVDGDVVENPEKTVNLEPPDEPGNLEPLDEIEIDLDLDLDLGEEEGDVVRIGEDIEIEADDVVDGDVVSIGADIRVDGTVLGDVVATSGDVTLGPTARVTGDVASVLGKVHREEGAVVGGEVVETSMGPEGVKVGGKYVVKSEKAKKVKQAKKLAAECKAEEAPCIAYKISLHVPEAQDVRLTGSFIDWDPEGIRMKRDEDGTWRTTYEFPQGHHLYGFIVDGKFIADPDEPDKMTPDGRGGFATSLAVGAKSKEVSLIKFSLFRPDAEDVRVTGNFNDWDEEGIKMTKDEKGTWWITLPVEPGLMLYKFYIDGVWGPDPDVAEQAPDGMGGMATPYAVKAPAKKASFELKVGESIKERKGNNVDGSLDYNRVDGLYLGLIASNQSNMYPLPRFYLEGGHSFKRDRWLYGVELEQPILGPFAFSVGGSFYDKTDSYDKEIVSDGENLISSSLLKRDYRDYFDHRGATAFVALRPFQWNTLKLAYISDVYRPLATRAHAGIFRRHEDFDPNPHNRAIPDEDSRDPDLANPYQICCDPVTGERLCDKIMVKAMTVSYEFDSRDKHDTPSHGLWARAEAEWAGGDFGGDLDYSRYLADLRFYNKISSRQKYAIRVKAGGMDVPCDASCCEVPGPEYFFPKQFYVGGIGTLPGYDYKEFRGTHMVLLNAEYFIGFKGGAGLVFFADGGDARMKARDESAGDVVDAMKLKYDVGVALRHETSGEHVLTIGVAKRLDDTDEPMLVTMRASRPF
jgi:cytoskeletal protein CcmA (bactofilin family)